MALIEQVECSQLSDCADTRHAARGHRLQSMPIEERHWSLKEARRLAAAEAEEARRWIEEAQRATPI
jgi:hypothetical protein